MCFDPDCCILLSKRPLLKEQNVRTILDVELSKSKAVANDKINLTGFRIGFRNGRKHF